MFWKDTRGDNETQDRTKQRSKEDNSVTSKPVFHGSLSRNSRATTNKRDESRLLTLPTLSTVWRGCKKKKGSASSNTKDREQPEDEEGGKETRRLALTISRLRFAYAWPARRPEVRPRKRR